MLASSTTTIDELWLPSNDFSSSSDGCLTDIVIACKVKSLTISYNKTIGQTEDFFPKYYPPPHQ